jgi:16S rRNA (cytidine1402-2'-O)-methyltransferase
VSAARGTLYLVPMPLGSGDLHACLPQDALATVARLTRFIAEDARTARRVLTKLPLDTPIRDVEFGELNEHTRPADLAGLLTPLLAGTDVGLVSEAGCPVIADPGAAVVALAHEHGIRVAPLIGPSAVLLALMGSGLSGQAFRFHGYLPVDPQARRQRIVAIEQDSARSDCTHLFIETPYRNDQMLGSLLECCQPSTRLSVCVDLTLPTEAIVTRAIVDWRNSPRPDLDRRPAVFVLAAPRPTGPARRTRR